MADHLQQQILEAYQATLVAAATAAGARVYLDRVDEIPQANLPALQVDGQGESVESTSVDWAQVQFRSYTFSVACVVALASGAAASARNLGKQVEQALLASHLASTAGGLAKSLRLESSSEEKDPDAALSMFAVRQNWIAEYVTQSGIPDASF